MSRYTPTLTRMDAPTAALSEACGGQPYFWNRGTDARIVAARSHESSVIVSVRCTRLAHVVEDLRAALIAEAPAEAQRRRTSADEARAKAAALLADAARLDAEAVAIDNALAAMVTK